MATVYRISRGYTNDSQHSHATATGELTVKPICAIALCRGICDHRFELCQLTAWFMDGFSPQNLNFIAGQIALVKYQAMRNLWPLQVRCKRCSCRSLTGKAIRKSFIPVKSPVVMPS